MKIDNIRDAGFLLDKYENTKNELKHIEKTIKNYKQNNLLTAEVQLTVCNEGLRYIVDVENVFYSKEFLIHLRELILIKLEKLKKELEELGVTFK